MTAARILPGDGPLFGAGSRFAPQTLAPHLRARESARLDSALATIEARRIEESWDNPPLRAGFAALDKSDRDRLLLAPDFRRWLARLLWALDPRAASDAALPVQVQAMWNQLAIPWLKSEESERGALWLLVYGDGRVPFPGSGLSLTSKIDGRRVRLVASGEELRLTAENGDEIVSVRRRDLLAAAAGGPPPPGFDSIPRLPETAIEVVGDRDRAYDQALAEAPGRLATAWPAGHELVTGLVHRVLLDPNLDLHSKTESELPGVVILGRRRTDAAGIAEVLVHEAAHLLVYEIANVADILPAPHVIRNSPFIREGRRPAYMVLHGTVSFLAQAIATFRLAADAAAVSALDGELARLEAGEHEISAHLESQAADPHPFIQAVSGELDLLRQTLGSRRR